MHQDEGLAPLPLKFDSHMAKAFLHIYTVNPGLISGLISEFDCALNGSIMVLSDTKARELSGSISEIEVKNSKTLIRTEGVNAGYWKEVLGGQNGNACIVMEKRSPLHYDIGCFRTGNVPLSGVVYKNDPAAFSSDTQGNWWFIQSHHADPNGSRYQAASIVQSNLKGCERDHVYAPNELSSPELKYFDSELAKNAAYCDKMIRNHKINLDSPKTYGA